MRLVRLNPVTDEAIYRTLYGWNKDTPGFFRASDDCWGVDSFDEFYERSNRGDLIDCAVYSGDDLQGSITVIEKAPKVFETFIVGKRSSDRECLTMAAYTMAKDLMDTGIADVFTSWVYEKNRGAIKLNKDAGMLPTGIVLIKGSYKGRPLKFINLAMNKERVMNYV